MHACHTQIERRGPGNGTVKATGTMEGRQRVESAGGARNATGWTGEHACSSTYSSGCANASASRTRPPICLVASLSKSPVNFSNKPAFSETKLSTPTSFGVTRMM